MDLINSVDNSPSANSDEAFVTGTFAGIITVSEIDGHAIESEEITSKIRKMYEQKLM